MLAFKNNYICIHVWDWTDINSVLRLLCTDISLDKIIFTEPSVYYYNITKKKLTDMSDPNAV